ncbi:MULTISPECIES: AAA family ATPase [unclassified Micromonospora]|uniref:AAA family ATPase n=1 Tax=unclassified Micromonospora TaxID=2617518 RepID=UPI003634FDBE
MRRILVVGSSGAGKSTLARAVARRLDLPLVHLDRHYWRPGWVAPDRAVWRTTVAALAAEPAWVMDGNYGSTLDLRLPRADLLVLVDLPWPLCLARVVRRRWARRSSGRPDLPPGCPERLDLDFLGYVARYPRRSRPRVFAAVAGHAPELPVVRLRSRAQVRRWLALLPPP